MGSLLLILAFLNVYVLVSSVQKKRSEEFSCSLAFVFVLLIISVFVFTSTELLSFFNLITTTAIQISWLLFILISGFLIFRYKISFKNIGAYLPKHLFKENKAISISILFILITTLLMCFIVYPNTWDSMTYHLSRIMHWQQNKNVEHYPTAIDRQVSFQPFAEYFMMHAIVLSGADRAANFIQWIFMCGSLCVVYLLVKEIGGYKKAQLLAVLFAVTIPMGILQCTGTQTDYVNTFFTGSAVLFLFKCIKNKSTTQSYIAFSVCCALACITKGTAYIYLPPVVIIFAASVLWTQKFGAIKIGAIAILVYLFFNSLYLWRNYTTSDNIFGDDYDLQNAAISLNGTLSNLSKNFVMHFRTPFVQINAIENDLVEKFHTLINIDINSKYYNWPPSPSFTKGGFSRQEDSAGSLLHVILFVIVIFFFLFQKKYRNKNVVLSLLIIVCMFFSFCLLLKWQIWHVRLHLPMLVLTCVPAGYLVSNWNTKIQSAICILFFLYSLPFLFSNQSKPLIGKENVFVNERHDQYFFNNRQLKKQFVDVAEIIKKNNLQNIGWAVTGDSWEYPMWVLLEDNDSTRMEHILVPNKTEKWEHKEPFNSFIPDAIITTRIEPDTLNQVYYKGKTYLLVYKNENWKFYTTKSP